MGGFGGGSSYSPSPNNISGDATIGGDLEVTGTIQSVSTSTQQKWSYDADSFATLTVADDGATTIETSETGNLTLNSDDIFLVADGGLVAIQNPAGDNKFAIDVENASPGNVFLSNVKNADVIFRVGTGVAEVFRIDQSEDSMLLNTDSKVQFRDTATSINSPSADVLQITAPTLEVSNDLVLEGPTVPASAGATGTAGQISWDADFIYICVAADTWKRVAISTWP
ncbi:MAG: hypothetical protein NZ730_00060 [Porticoccaceae bacterium]|nr:hypothetical protein [Porticoccaceae bacterium]